MCGWFDTEVITCRHDDLLGSVHRVRSTIGRELDTACLHRARYVSEDDLGRLQKIYIIAKVSKEFIRVLT